MKTYKFNIDIEETLEDEIKKFIKNVEEINTEKFRINFIKTTVEEWTYKKWDEVFKVLNTPHMQLYAMENGRTWIKLFGKVTAPYVKEMIKKGGR